MLPFPRCHPHIGTAFLFILLGAAALAATPPHLRVVDTGGSIPPADVLGIDEAAATAYVETHNPLTLRGIDLSSGQTKYVIGLNDAEQRAQIVVDAALQRAVVVHSLPSTMRTTVTTYDLARGHIVHQVMAPCCVVYATADLHTDRAFIIGGFGNQIQTTLYVLDTVTGTPIQTMTVGLQPLLLSVDAANNRVFLVDARARSNAVSTFDATTGSLIHSFPISSTPGTLVSDPVRHRAFLSDKTGSDITVLNTDTGTRARTFHVLQVANQLYPASMAIDASVGHIYMTSAVGINIYDTAAGQFRGSITMGGLHGWIGTLAVDDIAHRLFAGLIDYRLYDKDKNIALTSYVGTIDERTRTGHQTVVGTGHTTVSALESTEVGRMAYPSLAVDGRGHRLVLAGFFNTIGHWGRGNSISIVADRNL